MVRMDRRITISADRLPVVICGAGLPHIAGVPLQAELSSAVIPDGMARIYNLVRDRPLDAPIDIEEFLTSIDFEDALQSVKPQEGRLNSRTYLQALAIEIYNATAATKWSSRVLGSFFEQVARLWKIADTIITTNWDTLLECYAHRQYGTLDLLTCRPPRKSLLKVHGSIDWFALNSKEHDFVARDHFQRIAGKYFRYKPFSEGEALFHIYKSAAAIVDEVPPALIAPTHLKEIPRGLFRRIWRAAYRVLQQARHVVIIGYSLPPSDRLIAELLMASRYPHIERQVVESVRVSVVDPDPSGTVRQRYEGLFGPQIEFHQVGFEDLEFRVV